MSPPSSILHAVSKVKKPLLKTTLVLVIFCLMFVVIQRIILIIVINRNEYLDSLQASYRFYQQESGKIDVCILGSSPLYTGISPMILWRESGVTSVNFATSQQTAMLTYFQLQALLNIQKPKLVIMDLCSLFDARKADDPAYASVYQKVLLTLPDKKLKQELIRTILADNTQQNPLYLYFPLLRYHDHWAQFRFSRLKTHHPVYFRGALLRNESFDRKAEPEAHPELEHSTISDYSLDYYLKLVDLCQRHGIKILVLNMPKNHMSWSQERIAKAKELCEQNDMLFLDFNVPAEQENLKLTQDQDYYDEGHLNARGCFKFSQALARKLSQLYDLTDHRGQPEFANWQKDADAFHKDYQDILEPLEHEHRQPRKSHD